MAAIYSNFATQNERGKTFYLAGIFNGLYFAGFGGGFCCMLRYLQFSYKKILSNSNVKVSPSNMFTIASANSRASEVVEDGYTDKAGKTFVINSGDDIRVNE